MLQLAATFLAQKLVGKEKDIVLGNTTKQVCFGLGVYLFFFLSLSIDISMFISISNLYVHKHTYTHTFFLEQFRQVLVVGTPTPLPTFAPAGGETPGGTTQGETPVPGTLSGDRPKIILPDESDKLYSNICFF